MKNETQPKVLFFKFINTNPINLARIELAQKYVITVNFKLTKS